MFPVKIRSIAVIATVLTATPYSRAVEPTIDELKQQISELQTRLQAVEQRQSDEASRAEVQRTVQQMIKDAEARSKFFSTDGDITAGYDKGFFIRSSDGNFVMRPGLLVQFRNVTNVTTGDDGQVQNGFEVRRFRPGIEGNLFSPDFTYKVVLDANRTGGGVTLLDAVGVYKFAPRWSIKAGQFRNSWVHEGDVPDYSQLAVERSLIDALLGGSQTDRVQGVALMYGATDQPLRTELTFHDGANSKNTNYQDVPTDFGMSARVEYKLAGDWADYRSFSARLNKKNLLVIGGGVDWTQGEGPNNTPGGYQDTVRTTADIQYETTNRWIFYGELNGNIATQQTETEFDWGVLGQVGYAVDMHWEPFFRYDVVSQDVGDGQDAYNEFTLGFNYYFGPNGSYNDRCKFSMDMLFLPDGAPSNLSGVGVVESDDFEFVLRAQIQLML